MTMLALAWRRPVRRSALALVASLSLSFAGTPAPARGDAPGAASILLTQGTTYRARLRLSFFQCLASKDRIRRKLQGSGFGDVRVFTSARDLPADWPAQFRRGAGSCERFAEGIWSRPTMPRKRPASIEAWWVAPAPP